MITSSDVSAIDAGYSDRSMRLLPRHRSSSGSSLAATALAAARRWRPRGDNGEGLAGETDDKIITFFSLGVAVFFVLVVTIGTIIQIGARAAQGAAQGRRTSQRTAGSAVAVHYERRGAAAVVTIDRQERRNAVDGPTAELLTEAYRKLRGRRRRARDDPDRRGRRRLLRRRRPEGDRELRRRAWTCPTGRSASRG